MLDTGTNMSLAEDDEAMTLRSTESNHDVDCEPSGFLRFAAPKQDAGN